MVIAVAFFKLKRIVIGLTNGSKEDQITHTKTFPALRLNELNDYKNFCGSVVHHVLSCSSLLPQNRKRNTFTREAVTFIRRLFITLRYFDTVSTLKDLKFISALQYVHNPLELMRCSIDYSILFFSIAQYV